MSGVAFQVESQVDSQSEGFHTLQSQQERQHDEVLRSVSEAKASFKEKLSEVSQQVGEVSPSVEAAGGSVGSSVGQVTEKVELVGGSVKRLQSQVERDRDWWQNEDPDRWREDDTDGWRWPPDEDDPDGDWRFCMLGEFLRYKYGPTCG